jgi:hypothetical protein
VERNWLSYARVCACAASAGEVAPEEAALGAEDDIDTAEEELALLLVRPSKCCTENIPEGAGGGRVMPCALHQDFAGGDDRSKLERSRWESDAGGEGLRTPT